jgi:hypothetical protein
LADITITAANCVASETATRATGTAGTTITAGQVVYLASATKKWLLADADSATAEARKAGGIALNGASLNQPLVVATSGDITLGGTMTAGTALYVSGTPGGICPVADVATGDYPCIVGMAKSATVLAINIQFPNVLI